MNNTRELNNFEKEINKILVTNKYDTDEKILQKENEQSLKVNPKELEKRHQELKKLRYLLFQKEHDSKRRAKIKSKLYHKIKKKQREREEKILLERLGEVDPEAVQNYLEKKNMDRIKERIELKHSFNSKFNKTVKRYNLQNDLNVKEAIKENLKLRDELMKKIQGKDHSDSENDEENSDYDENENDNDSENNAESAEYSAEGEEEDDEEDIKKENLLIDFEDDNKNNNINKKAKNNEQQMSQSSGVWGMKFMEKSSNNELKNKLKNVLEEVDSESFDLEEDEDEENFRNKKYKNSKANNNSSSINRQKALTDDNKLSTGKPSKATFSRRKNVLETEEEKDKSSNIISADASGNRTKNKITSEILNELNDDAEEVLKDHKKPTFSNEEIKKIVEIEEIQQDEDLFNKFLVSNETNKKEFLEKPKDNKEDYSNFLPGWNSWTGESKEIQAKEFLRKKRYQQIQNKKNINNANNPNPNPHVKINNQFDKKVKYLFKFFFIN